MKVTLILLIVSALLLSHPALSTAQQTPANTQQNPGWTVEQIVALVRAGASDETLLRIIQQSPSDYNLSLRDIDALHNAGVHPVVIDAMLQSRRSGFSRPPTPEPTDNGSGGPTPPSNINPGAANPGNGGGAQGGGTNTTGGGTGTAGGATNSPGGNAAPQMPEHTPQRLNEARNVRTDLVPVPLAAKYEPDCPAGSHQIALDYENAHGAVPRLNKNGTYCFVLAKNSFNPLYDYAITPQITTPTGNPFDLINDAIQHLKSIVIGAAATSGSTPAGNASNAKPPTPQPVNPAKACPVDVPRLTDALATVTLKATRLQRLLAALEPNASSPKYVTRKTTFDEWAPIYGDYPSLRYNPATDDLIPALKVKNPGAYAEFEEAIRVLKHALPQSSDTSGCEASVVAQLAQSEAILVDDYPVVRDRFEELANRLLAPEIPHSIIDAEATDTAEVRAASSYAGTSVETKTYHFEPSYGILTSSAGFVLTSLSARAYSSATAPNPADPTMTQNVLRVDYGSGVRSAFLVLLTGNIPRLNSHNFGLGVSAGPLFDVASGKADTSRFGFFTGLSARVTPWIFLTPGFHFGEFADFPQGFTRPGQVIPTGTGTPTPVKRFTAHFAFGVTFKLKDLGSTTGTTPPR